MIAPPGFFLSIEGNKWHPEGSHSGDNDAMSFNPDFENLVKLYYRDLYRFGLSLTASEADVADLKRQETFYIWANKGHQLKNPAKVKAWLFTTLHRQFSSAGSARAPVASSACWIGVTSAPMRSAA